MAVQGAVPWEVRGVVTSTTQLFRSLGGTIGVALLGALLNGRLQAALPDAAVDRAALLDPAARAALGADKLAALQGALAAALQPVFAALVVLAAIGLAVMLRYAHDALFQPAPASTPPSPEATPASVDARSTPRADVEHPARS